MDNNKELPITLGTVQFGLDYGVNNAGKPSAEEVNNIFKLARDSNIKIIDTAAAYGNAEEIIGNNSDILSSIKIGSKIAPNITANEVASNIKASLKKVKRQSFDYIMLHNFEHYKTDIWEQLLELKNNRLIKKLGVSIYSPEQTNNLDSDIDIIQLPFNILDHRWDGFFANSKDIEVHVRSIYLQGLLLNDELLKERGYGYLTNKFNMLVEKLSRKNRMDLFFAYVRAIKDIDKIVIGVDNLDQLKQNLSYFDSPQLTPQEVSIIKEEFCNTPEKLLDVRKW